MPLRPYLRTAEPIVLDLTRDLLLCCSRADGIPANKQGKQTPPNCGLRLTFKQPPRGPSCGGQRKYGSLQAIDVAAIRGFEFDIFIPYFSTTCTEPTIGLYRFNQTGQSATKHARLSDPSRTAPFRLVLGGTAAWRNRPRQPHLLSGGHGQAVGLPHKGGPRKSTPNRTALYKDVPDSWTERLVRSSRRGMRLATPIPEQRGGSPMS